METFRKYVMPGCIFQSLIIGGGYATGRELIEFFFPSGPAGGMLGLLISGLTFGIVLATAFEFARVTGAYDYRSFFRELLGPAWVIFEIAYFAILILVLSVIASAAGELGAGAFDAPPLVGTLALMSLVVVLTFYGTRAIKLVLSSWALLLCGVYLVIFVLIYIRFADQINAVFTSVPVGGRWIVDGVRYSSYSLSAIPAVLFSVVHLTRRRETLGAGLIAGLLAIFPAMLFYTAMMSQYPQIGGAAVPAAQMMSALDLRWLELVFLIVVFGTLVQTGAGLLHAVNERLDVSFQAYGKRLPQYARALVATVLLVVSVFAASTFGIINLIARGYGALTYAFIAVLIVPLLTIGICRIARARKTSVT